MVIAEAFLHPANAVCLLLGLIFLVEAVICLMSNQALLHTLKVNHRLLQLKIRTQLPDLNSNISDSEKAL